MSFVAVDWGTSSLRGALIDETGAYVGEEYTLVLSTLARSWSFAVDREQRAPHAPLPYRALSLLPLGILTALLVQSLAESRLLVEFGMLLLVLIAVKTKRGDRADAAP